VTTETDKPPIEDLRQFLDFQLPREWAPIHGKIHLDSNWKNQVNDASLRFSILGPKLYINTNPVSFPACISYVF